MDEESTVASLQAKVLELEEKRDELLSAIEAKENEFGLKRAQFKELFLQRETELNDEKIKLGFAREENAKLLANLQKVSAERDDLKTAVVIAETSNDDKLTAMKFKYQEEIASLKAIMHDAVQDTRQEAKEKYEDERMTLVVANQELEKKLAKYKAQIRELKSKQQQTRQQQQQPSPQQEQQQQDEGNDGLFDVLPWKQAASTPEAVPEGDENLEDSMKKAQEDAETLRSIVMPLEEEIASLKSKLKNANDKISVLETKQEKKPAKPSQTVAAPDESRGNGHKDEKIKELTQYLEAERSARTDLEMFVAVLNTQKSVLQEDADKLRKELHNVCRLLEQEKEEHLALKDTWEMANDRFLETQRVQKLEMDKIKKLLTSEQLHLLGDDPKEKKNTVKLLTPPSPVAAKRFLNRKTSKQNTNKKDNSKARNSSSSESKRPLASLIQRSSKSSSLPSTPSSILDTDVPQFVTGSAPLTPNTLQPVLGTSSDSADSDNRSLNAFSDGETTAVVSGGTMKKYKSADDLESGLTPASKANLRSRSEELAIANEQDSDVVKRGKENIDWKSFEEAAKTSLSNDVDRSCQMCKNYEKQLQKRQQQNDSLSDEISALSVKLKEKEETVVVVKRACERLEQSVKVASEDAQAQIKVAMDTQRGFQSLLDEITADFDKTRKETSKEVSELMLARDSLLAKYEQLSENSRSLQKQNLVQVEQRQAENVEDQTQSTAKEAALQSEINFMKDRVMAEQTAKDSLEELYQAEIESLGQEIKKLKSQLAENSKRHVEQLPQDTSQGVIATLKKELQLSTENKNVLVNQVKQLKSQLHSLNGQLNNSEAVQRDFVKLSQSLQMELEQIKEGQKDIKWEHEDDVSSCRKCEKPLNVTQDKHHCRECGRIFCDNCSSQTMNNPSSSSPPGRVCVDCIAGEKSAHVSERVTLLTLTEI